MARPYRTLQDWAAVFEQAARELLEGQGVGPEQDGYRVAVADCERHGPGCVRVTYGMFREHLRWAVEDPRRLAERAVGTMLPARAAEIG
jgi:hypothetical protein